MDPIELKLTPNWHPHYRGLHKQAIEQAHVVDGIVAARQLYPTEMVVLYREPQHTDEAMSQVATQLSESDPKAMCFWVRWPLPAARREDVVLSAMDLTPGAVSHLSGIDDPEKSAHTLERFRQFAVSLAATGGIESLQWEALWERFQRT